MDFYLTAQRFLTDLAVNAKSCLNSNELLPWNKKRNKKRNNFLLTDEKQSGKIIFVAEENGQAVKKTDYSFKRKIKMFLTKYDSLW